MSRLRERMIEDMVLRDLAEKTQTAYVGAVRQFAAHFKKSPEQITEEEIRQYFVYLTTERQVSYSTCSIALNAIKFLYQHTLQREWTTLDLVRPAKPQTLPVVLSREEVKRVLGCLRRPAYRACLSTIYGCGLRLGEGVGLSVADVDGDRMCLHIRQGKGAKDRYVPLPAQVLEQLRAYWVLHRHPVLIFPALHRSQSGKLATQPMCASGVQRAFRGAVAESGMQKKATVHTLRHSWVTHLLEEGVSLRVLQAYLGHNSPKTTARYTHVSQRVEDQAQAALQRLMVDITDEPAQTPW